MYIYSNVVVKIFCFYSTINIIFILSTCSYFLSILNIFNEYAVLPSSCSGVPLNLFSECILPNTLILTLENIFLPLPQISTQITLLIF